MGPPDKREPKPSSDVFEYTYTNVTLPATKDLAYTKENSSTPNGEASKNTKSVADNYTMIAIDNHCLGDKGLPTADSNKSLIASREVMLITALL